MSTVGATGVGRFGALFHREFTRNPRCASQPATGADSPADADAAPQPALLPDFCSLPMALGVVLYGELLAFLLTLASQ
jgi:hypothetical protein